MDKCQKIVHPLKKGAQDYECRREHYKDGWCKQHHPDLVAAKEKQLSEDSARWKAERLEANKSALTIENAIVLLVQNGYRVEKVVPNVKLTGSL
jgi:hypothetical protein